MKNVDIISESGYRKSGLYRTMGNGKEESFEAAVIKCAAGFFFALK